jgi:hypothetical protein
VIATKISREHLRLKMVHAAQILHEQGPISTFIHTNTLHGFEHLPVKRPTRSQLYLSGRITDAGPTRSDGIL